MRNRKNAEQLDLVIKSAREAARSGQTIGVRLLVGIGIILALLEVAGTIDQLRQDLWEALVNRRRPE